MIEIESGRDGRPGLVSLDHSDHDLVARLFYRLSPESVYRRFFSPTTRPDQLARSVLRGDHHDREAIGAVEHGEGVGMAQYSRPPGARSAELAVVVAEGWQRQGLGPRLGAAAAGGAAGEGVGALAGGVQG